MRNQPPHRTFGDGWADGSSGLAQADGLADRGQPFNHKIAIFAAEWQPRRPVKVSAAASHSKRIGIRRGKHACQVHQREHHLGALFTRHLSPSRMPEALPLFFDRVVAECVERLDLDDLARDWIGCYYIVNRKHFHRMLAANVRDDWILKARLVDLNRLCGLRKQIYDGSAAQTERAIRNAHLQHLLP